MNEFINIWDEFNGKLLNYIKSMVSNEHDAEDILQNVFMKIYKSVDKLEDSSAVKSWIYTIAKNSVIDFYKKKKEISVPPENLNNIEDEIESKDNLNDEVSVYLKNMLFTLPEKYKDVYDMYENKEMNHKEIAEELDISLSNSKVRLKRAKDIFKERLLECCDFEVDTYGNIINYKRKDNCNGHGKGCL